MTTDLIVKCTQYRMSMKMTHCLTKCGYAIRGDKPCADLAAFIDARESDAIPLIAQTPCSAPFSRAFADDIARAREFALTKIIPAKVRTPPPPKPAPVVPEALEPTPAPATPPQSAVTPKEPVMSTDPAPVPPAPAAPAPAPAVPVAAAPAAAPAPAPAAVPAVPATTGRRASSRAAKPKEDPMPRGIPNSPKAARRVKAPSAVPTGELLIMVESRSKSGKFQARSGDLAQMLSLRAAGRRVIVITEVEKPSPTDKSLVFTETRAGSGKYTLKADGGPAVIKASSFHDL